MPRIEALMIDVDGVLVTGRPGDGRHWSAQLEPDLGIDVDTLHRRFFSPHWDAVVTGRADLRSQLSEALAAIAPQVGVDRLLDYWFRNDSKLNLELLTALAERRAAGLPVHLATNQEHERARYLRDEIGLGARFDGFHYSAALGCRKPDRRFFDAVARDVGIAPGALLLLDDSPDNVEGALAAGWQAVRWTGTTTLTDAIGRYLPPR